MLQYCNIARLVSWYIVILLRLLPVATDCNIKIASYGNQATDGRRNGGLTVFILINTVDCGEADIHETREWRSPVETGVHINREKWWSRFSGARSGSSQKRTKQALGTK